MLGPGDFFGEGCLAGQPVRMGSATAIRGEHDAPGRRRRQMVRLLHEQHGFSDRFIAHMLARNIRIEEDLVDQLFNSSEKRLARTLLLLARYGKHDNRTKAAEALPGVLAEMVGTTRSRVNFFMNKFRRLGFIEYKRRDQNQQVAVERRPARLTSEKISRPSHRRGYCRHPRSRRFPSSVRAARRIRPCLTSRLIAGAASQ